ncbi:hypothetical protein EG68_12224 [Paragonimus skrjabini miyazakii]|uniref:Uncharacterized protein n=1 Tax=Paragonimus skrjabini miyazakii TaxID=59628 RepID=A0A8S9YKE5_9TREM|nr:hypothetical protein EG68_12224 [Paragonimus skrjabini miyazakii]
MVARRELRLPVDSTLPLTAIDLLLSVYCVTKLLRDLQMTHQLARNPLSGYQHHLGSPLQPGASVYIDIFEQVLSDRICRIRGPGKPDMHSFTARFNKLKPTTKGVTALPPSNWVATNDAPLGATVHVEISPKEEASTEVAHAEIRDYVFLRGGDFVLAKTHHTCNFVHAFSSLPPNPEIGVEERYKNTPNK